VVDESRGRPWTLLAVSYPWTSPSAYVHQRVRGSLLECCSPVCVDQTSIAILTIIDCQTNVQRGFRIHMFKIRNYYISILYIIQTCAYTYIHTHMRIIYIHTHTHAYHIHTYTHTHAYHVHTYTHRVCT